MSVPVEGSREDHTELKLRALRETLNASIAKGGSHTWEDIEKAVRERLLTFRSLPESRSF